MKKENKLPTRFPTYVVMPPEFNWKLVEEALNSPEVAHQVVPGIGAIIKKTEIWGSIQATKTILRMNSKEIKQEKFGTVIHTGCQIGRCFKFGTAKDFVYPTNRHVLSSISTNQISYQEVARYISWAECTPEQIKLVMFPTIQERQAKYKYWLEKLKDEQEALKKVVMKTIWTFSAKELGIIDE